MHLVGLEPRSLYSTSLLRGEEVPFELELIDLYGLMFVAKYYSSYFLCMLYMN